MEKEIPKKTHSQPGTRKTRSNLCQNQPRSIDPEDHEPELDYTKLRKHQSIGENSNPVQIDEDALLSASGVEALLDSIAEPVAIYNAAGIPRRTNQASVDMFGFDLSGHDRASLASQLSLRYPDGSQPDPEVFPVTRALRGEKVKGEQFLFTNPRGEDYIVIVSANPFFIDGRLVGVVVVWSDITQIKRAEEAVHKDAARASVLAALSQSFAEAGLYFPAVLSTISQAIAESIGGACIIRMVSDDGLWLDPVAVHHTNPEALASIRKTLRSARQRVDEGLAGRVFQSGEPLAILENEIPNLEPMIHPEFAHWIEQHPVQSVLFVPLRVQDHRLGTLSVLYPYTQRPSSHAAEDQFFIQDLADRAALAIENARLYSLEAQRLRELDALHTATAALLSTLDLDTLLTQILDSAQNAIPAAEKGALHLVAPETGRLQIRAVFGLSDPRIQRFVLHHSTDSAARAVRERRPLLIRDLPPDPPGKAEASDAGRRAVRSQIVAPLILENDVLGALSLSSSRLAAFDEADLRLLVSFAATTTAAIQNATLHAEVQRSAITDQLTGQYNRRGFFDLGKREIERFHRFGRPLSLIMLDVDHFKRVNDTLGHAAGDAVLHDVANRCCAQVRHVDIAGRVGGEEFAILLPETDLHTAGEVAERIRRAVAEQPFDTGREPISLTVSLGVAPALPDTQDVASLLDRADAALYVAKRKGRNRVEVA
ncbi:MAG: diguanylate cyclase [Chloroflexi bacterium]|nr:diguanylate cyclase [Chloroflexota bacterium]